jgi:hypothetical protein
VDFDRRDGEAWNAQDVGTKKGTKKKFSHAMFGEIIVTDL